MATAGEDRRVNLQGMAPVTIKDKFEGKWFTHGTETEAGGTSCEHSVLATSYLKLQMHLRCSWAERRGTLAACTDTPRTGALERCWVQLQQLES